MKMIVPALLFALLASGCTTENYNRKYAPTKTPTEESVTRLCGDVTKMPASKSFRYFVPLEWDHPYARQGNNSFSLLAYDGPITFCDCAYNMVRLRELLDRPKIAPVCMNKFEKEEGIVWNP